MCWCRENIKCLPCIILSRLICVDASRENVNCLACIYLNEYKIAVAAFTLHANDAKIIKVCSFFGRNFISRNAIKIEIFSLIFLMWYKLPFLLKSWNIYCNKILWCGIFSPEYGFILFGMIIIKYYTLVKLSKTKLKTSLTTSKKIKTVGQ